jgi:hypothetical protein
MSCAAGLLVSTEVSERAAYSSRGVLCSYCVSVEFECVVHVMKRYVGVWTTSAASYAFFE